MIDDIKGITSYKNEKVIDRICRKPGIVFQRERVSSITGNRVIEYKLSNLRIRVIPAEKIIITENSLHRFCHKNNYDDFTFHQLKAGVAELSDILEHHSQNIRIVRFEFGLIIQTEHTPEYYFEKFQHLRQRPFIDMPPRHPFPRSLGRYSPSSQYKVKFYNAGKWNHVLNANLLKYEIQFIKMQKVYDLVGGNPKTSPITLGVLMDRVILDQLAHFCFDTYLKIEKSPLIDCSGLKPHVRNFLFAGITREYWIEEKRINIHTAKKKRTRFLQLCNKLNSRQAVPYNELDRKFKDKYNYLIGN